MLANLRPFALVLVLPHAGWCALKSPMMTHGAGHTLKISANLFVSKLLEGDIYTPMRVNNSLFFLTVMHIY